MHTLTITDEMANKLHTMYEHIDEHKHYVHEHEDTDMACEIAKTYCEQENELYIETNVDNIKVIGTTSTDKYSVQEYVVNVTLTPEQQKVLHNLSTGKLKIRISN